MVEELLWTSSPENNNYKFPSKYKNNHLKVLERNQREAETKGHLEKHIAGQFSRFDDF